MAGRGVRLGCIYRNEKQSCCDRPEPADEAHGAIFADASFIGPFAASSAHPHRSVPPEPALWPLRQRSSQEQRRSGTRHSGMVRYGFGSLTPLVAVPRIRHVKENPKGDNFPVHVTRGHEAEAREAQLRKPPSRLGTWILRRLGYKGPIEQHTEQALARPSHEHPVRQTPAGERASP